MLREGADMWGRRMDLRQEIESVVAIVLIELQRRANFLRSRTVSSGTKEPVVQSYWTLVMRSETMFSCLRLGESISGGQVEIGWPNREDLNLDGFWRARCSALR